MVDVMRNAGNFIPGYSGGLLYSYFLTIPPSVAANLAFPQKTGKVGKPSPSPAPPPRGPSPCFLLSFHYIPVPYPRKELYKDGLIIARCSNAQQ